MNDLTTLLDGAKQGDHAAVDRLFAAMYPELRQFAHARLRHSEQITLLDTTSLVHESYLRFLKAGRVEVKDQSHFLAYASCVMRSVIVDLVRQRRTDRRGGGEIHVTLDTGIAESAHVSEDEILQINEALDDLAKVDARMVKVVEMRYFAGLHEQDIAASLGVTERTVRRDWEKARLLLREALE